MHPLTYKVMQSIPLLEFEQFRHVEDRERLNEVRGLAREQVNDDADASVTEQFRFGGRHGHVSRPGEIWGDEGTYQLWKNRTPEDEALAAAFEQIMQAELTGDQRILVRLRYDLQESTQDIAKRLGITKQGVSRRLAAVQKILRAALLKSVYGDDIPPEAEEKDRADPWKGEWDDGRNWHEA